MLKGRLPLIRIFLYRDRVVSQGYDKKRKPFRTNNFVLAHSSAKKKDNKQRYHMTECDVIKSLLS